MEKGLGSALSLRFSFWFLFVGLLFCAVFVFKVSYDFEKVNIDETCACVRAFVCVCGVCLCMRACVRACLHLCVCVSCLCVSLCVSLARDSSETIKAIIIKLGTVTASDIIMHRVLIILILTSIQDHIS